MQRIFSRIYISITFVLFCCVGAYGQVPPNPGDPDIPLTGLEWLLLGGGLWGAKKIYDLRRKK